MHGAQRLGVEAGVVKRGTTGLLDCGHRAIDADAQRSRPGNAASEQTSLRVLDAGATTRAATVDADEKRTGGRGAVIPRPV